MAEEVQNLSTTSPSSGKRLASPDQMIVTGSMVGMRNSYPDTISPARYIPATPASGSRLLRYHEFQCPLCPRSYAQKCSLYRHMKVHKDDQIDTKDVESAPTSDGKFKCPFCIAAYANSASLNVHVRTHAVGYRDMVKKPVSQVPKEEEAIFPCTLCNRVFQRRSRLTVHLNISHKNEHYGDMLNGDGDRGSDDLDDDLNEEEEELDSSGSFKRRLSAGGAFQCHICGSSYTRRTNLNKHLEKRHSFFSEPIPMDLSMGKDDEGDTGSPKDPNGLAEDMSSGKHGCPFCSFTTEHRYSLYRHMTSVHAEQKDLQDEMVKQVLGENQHRSDDEDMDGDVDEEGAKDEIFPCQFCSRVYMRKCNLTQHLKMHYNGEIESTGSAAGSAAGSARIGAEKERMAQFCSEVENEVSEVRRIIHLTKMNHDDQKDIHECAICGLTFGVKGSLILHLKMHERRALSKNPAGENGTKVSEAAMKSMSQLQEKTWPASPPQLIPGSSSSSGVGQMMSPSSRPMVSPQGVPDPGMFVMTQDKDGHTTIHNPQQYMLSHLQILNQVRNMIMFGRDPLTANMMEGMTSPSLPPQLMSVPAPRKRSCPSDDSGVPKKSRPGPKPGPKPGRHWKSLECDPNRRPVRKCSLCSFEIAEGNREGLLQHMAALHGVSCKLCPNVKFYTKRDFDHHCSVIHQYVMHTSEMEQLMVFGEIHEGQALDRTADHPADVGISDTSLDKLPSGVSSPMALPSPGLLTAAAVMNPALKKDNYKVTPAYTPEQDGQSGLDMVGMGQSRQTCPKCGLNYAQKSSLNRHIRTHHSYSRVEELIKAEKLAGNTLFGNYDDLDLDLESDQPPPLISMTPGQAMPLMNVASLSKPPKIFPAVPPLQTYQSMYQDEPLDLGKPATTTKHDSEVYDLSLSSKKVNNLGVSHVPLSDYMDKSRYGIMGTQASPSPRSTYIKHELPNNLPRVSRHLTPSPEPISNTSTQGKGGGRSRRKPQVVKRVVRNPTLDEEKLSWNHAEHRLDDDDDDDDVDDEWGQGQDKWNDVASSGSTSPHNLATQPLAALERLCERGPSDTRDRPMEMTSPNEEPRGDDDGIMDLSSKKKALIEEDENESGSDCHNEATTGSSCVSEEVAENRADKSLSHGTEHAPHGSADLTPPSTSVQLGVSLERASTSCRDTRPTCNAEPPPVGRHEPSSASEDEKISENSNSNDISDTDKTALPCKPQVVPLDSTPDSVLQLELNSHPTNTEHSELNSNHGDVMETITDDNGNHGDVMETITADNGNHGDVMETVTDDNGNQVHNKAQLPAPSLLVSGMKPHVLV